MTTSGTRLRTVPAAPTVGQRSPASPRLLAEAAILVGAACLLLHLAAAVGGHPRQLVLVAVLLVMAVACASCLRALWAGPSRRDWAVVGAMYGGMLLAHLVWLGLGTHTAHVHAATGLSWSELGMWGGLGLAGVQLGLSAAGLMLSREGNRT